MRGQAACLAVQRCRCIRVALGPFSRRPGAGSLGRGEALFGLRHLSHDGAGTGRAAACSDAAQKQRRRSGARRVPLHECGEARRSPCRAALRCCCCCRAAHTRRAVTSDPPASWRSKAVSPSLRAGARRSPPPRSSTQRQRWPSSAVLAAAGHHPSSGSGGWEGPSRRSAADGGASARPES
jgi:hypothetical protein